MYSPYYEAYIASFTMPVKLVGTRDHA